MFKKYKIVLVVTSLLVLAPIIVGACIWNRLPEQMAIHWGANGEADGYASRAMAVLGLPLVCFALHVVCAFITAHDPKNRGQNRKVTGLVLWLIPAISWFGGAVIYGSALGYVVPVGNLALALLGILFIAIGNYMPKAKQNHTIGIRLPWTLSDEGNWNATHRFAGRVWVIGGALMLLCMFLPAAVFVWALPGLVLLLTLLPFWYSYRYYRRHK